MLLACSRDWSQHRVDAEQTEQFDGASEAPAEDESRSDQADDPSSDGEVGALSPSGDVDAGSSAAADASLSDAARPAIDCDAAFVVPDCYRPCPEGELLSPSEDASAPLRLCGQLFGAGPGSTANASYRVSGELGSSSWEGSFSRGAGYKLRAR